MKRYLIQPVLLIGFVLIFISYLFFGRSQGTYMILVLIGSLLFLVGILIIIFQKLSVKKKLLMLSIASVFIISITMAKPLLKKCSYGYYINKNRESLDYIVNKCLEVEGEFVIFKDKIRHLKNDTLSDVNILSVQELMESIGSYIVYKEEGKIYFGLYGMLDVRIGIYYEYGMIKDQQFDIKIYQEGNWYSTYNFIY